MGRMLQCFLYIIVVTTSAFSQRDYSFYRGPRLLVNNGQSYLPQISKRVAFEDPKPKDVIIFDGPTSRKASGSFKPKIPEHCKEQGYCEEIENYPTDVVNQIINGLSEEEKKRFRSDEIDDTVEIVQRLGGGPSSDFEIELCDSYEKVIYPQSAPDKNDKWYTVLNLKDNKLQGIKVEICKAVKSSCSGIAHIQEGYIGGCKQKYFYRLLDVLDEDGKHVLKYLKLPSCCSCVVSPTGDLLVKK